MLSSLIYIIKIVALSAVVWLLADIISPGMMLIQPGGRLDRMFDLGSVSLFLKWVSLLLIALEVLGVFIKRDVINVLLAVAFVTVALYLISNFYIMW